MERVGDKVPVNYAMLGQYPCMRGFNSFFILWPTPFKGSNGDLSLLLSRMPGLERLELFHARDEFGTDFTSDILHLIARHCPKPYRLGLLINFRIPPSVETTNEAHTGFKKVTFLDFGQSLVGLVGPSTLAS